MRRLVALNLSVQLQSCRYIFHYVVRVVLPLLRWGLGLGLVHLLTYMYQICICYCTL